MSSQIKVNEILKQSGSSITIGTSGDTAKGVFTNTPSFKYSLSAAQSIPNTTYTKIVYDTLIWDTDSAVSSGTFTTPTGKGGKYYFQGSVEIGGIDDAEFVNIAIYKDSTSQEVARWYSTSSDDDIRAKVSIVLDLAAGETVSIYVYHNEGGSRDTKGGEESAKFLGYKLIG
mgnify:CR=1 FL=1|jgi:hypothetical protein|tara:strand:+ start:406 stop:921 length:516 start_codon:yes stop_codon:yes gene_type:complete